MDNRIIKFLGVFALMMFAGCGGGDDGPSEPIVVPPVASLLTAPEKDEVCLTGGSINEVQSEVEFIWEASQHTDSYNLVVKNLTTGASNTYTTTSQRQKLTLNKGEPYSWYVRSLSHNSKEMAQSEIWKFYLAGDGSVSYAPFPAELVSPDMGSGINAVGGSVTLAWKGADVDNDIYGYELLFDIVNPPLKVLGTTSKETYDVAVTAGTIYYWRVMTSDEQGNTSSSEVFQFKID